MIPAVRQERILEILSKNEIQSTETLMDELSISISTLRRDLAKLEQEHKIELLHGGGVKISQQPVELNITTKLNLNRDAKEFIAKKAAALVNEGDTIFLDPSSTTYLMIPYLANKNITILTNGLSHINQLILHDIPCLMIGGAIKKTTNSCIGPLTETMLQTLYFNKCFLGASGYAIHSGITNHDMNEQVIKTIALKNSEQPYFLMDRSKFGLIAMVKVADLDAYPIITDRIPEELSNYTNFIAL